MGGNRQWRGERQHNNAFLSEKQGQETWLPIADPGFPRRGTANPWVWGKNLLFHNIFAKKLHKNERNWTKRGRRASRALGSANGYVTTRLGHSKQIFFVHQQWSNLFRFFFHFQWRIHAHPWGRDSGTPGGSANDFPCLFNITAKMSSDNIPLTLINSLSCFHLLSSVNCVFLPFDQWNFSLAYVPV